MNHQDPQPSISRPIPIGEGIYWVGSFEADTTIQCNPFLIVEGDQGVLIDAGSRADFAKVMLNIMQTGMNPKNIVGLIYQHFDPDLCGSMANMIDICDNPQLKILSTAKNNLFISYYIHQKSYHLVEAIEKHGMIFRLGQRDLRFIETPYSHSSGSFVTYDQKTRTLFSSDLFGSLTQNKEIFLTLAEECYTCQNFNDCPNHREWCPLKAIINFHRKVMPCNKALHYAVTKIRDLDIEIIASQHGAIIKGQRDIGLILDLLGNLDKVGIDGIT